ncbi:MAG: ATP-grasp domain-containing protein [Clostridia bacterium]|nr:ATP-grasp domain-containing protein [Clostridia bacterium]
MNIAVIYGGESVEHEVSILTAVQLIENIAKDNIIIPIYITKQGKMYETSNYKNIDTYKNENNLKEVCFVPNSTYLYKKNIVGSYKKYKQIDFCYIAMHGKGGVDGTIASILNMSHIPYSSSDMLGSSVCLDKAIFKNAMFGLGINIVPYINVLKSDYHANKLEILDKIENNLGYPVIIKPSNLGSSIGINIAYSKDDIDFKINGSFLYDNMLVIEKYVDIDKEINVALFRYNNEMVFSCFEVPSRDDNILSFEDKYLKQGVTRKMLEVLDSGLDVKIKSMCEVVYKTLRLNGVVRFDFIYSKDGILYLNELNTIPGSMANYLYKERGIDYTELNQMLYREGVNYFKQKAKLNTNYDSKVLSKINSLKINK